MNKYLLQDVFDDWMTNGIFNALQSLGVPWEQEDIASSLDLSYFGNISGEKRISPLVFKLLNKDNASVLSSERISQLALTIFNINIWNWKKEYETLSYEYDPISNYDMTETGSDSTIRSQTKNNTGTQGITHTGTETTLHTGTETNTQSAYSQNGIFGFNSAEAVGADSTSGSGTDTRTDNLSDARTDNLTDTRTDNLSESVSGSEGLTHSLHRTGNIGVTSSQQLIEAQRQVALWNYFYEVVFPSVDKVLTIQTYSRSYIPELSAGSSGGSTNQIMKKLDEIDAKIDNIPVDIESLKTSTLSAIGTVNLNVSNLRVSMLSADESILSKTDSIQLAISQLRASSLSMDNMMLERMGSLELSVSQLRVSTFNAIDGVTTRSY